VHPFGSLFADPVEGEDDQLVSAEICLEDIKGVKRWVDMIGDYSRPEVLSLNHNPRN